MKLLEFIGYIKLPDDFEGDEIDALQWYVDYRKSKERPKQWHDIAENKKGTETTAEYMAGVYDMMIKDDATRGGVLRIQDSISGEFKITHGEE